MSLVWIVYLVSVVTSLNLILFIIGTISGCAIFAAYLFQFIELSDSVGSNVERAKRILSITNKCAIAFVAFLFLTIFIPNEETIKVMTGAYVADRVLDNPDFITELESLPTNAVKGLNDGLKILSQYANPVS